MKLLEISPPKPQHANIMDAISHADINDTNWKPVDFIFKYEGYLSISELHQFDDLSGWLEANSVEDLETYRDGAWNNKPHDVPPIIIITAPNEENVCYTQIGDGRGRVNYANVHKLKLHVWHLIHKKCTGA